MSAEGNCGRGLAWFGRDPRARRELRMGAGTNKTGAQLICFRNVLREGMRVPSFGPWIPNWTAQSEPDRGMLAPNRSATSSSGAGPVDAPMTSSDPIRYSLPCGLAVLDSSCSASAASRPSVSRWMSTVVMEGLQYSASRVLSNPVTEIS